jgi:hypothetical protein
MIAPQTWVRRIAHYLTFRSLANDDPASLARPNPWWENDELAEPVLDYALQSAIRSRDAAAHALDSLVAKGANQLTVSVAALIASVGATGLTISSAGQSWLHYMSVVTLLACDALVLVAAVLAYLVGEPNTTPSLNVDRFTSGEQRSVTSLQRREATVWHKAAMASLVAIQRKANDLYYSRCWLLWGLLIGVLGVVALAVSSGPSEHSQLIPSGFPHRRAPG